ncbi:hypothetical protein TREMEDRAFT_66338 [Tremella mesenterica DSM 1558]|uniref:uncharacterized protein n=1 Tax=Tremella mesenterica (strain ATCC 24925 / CBS 8224 / DSM 1558 / NBRC 9311 / NRRL Y-6157 / RJB 2259-6 / UBC 559-6) TaxID=578456 RepID=UPI00032BAE6C|nr:uncharacterized protein TREMEDRAFT_66338 [Tremella mesenterica DSM 1558]EIW65614.1 hypothetical protein TREMEDRAFT_66338 [Tremella mesenterica DSM 1558]
MNTDALVYSAARAQKVPGKGGRNHTELKVTTQHDNSLMGMCEDQTLKIVCVYELWLEGLVGNRPSDVCYGVTTNRANSIEFDGLGWRKAGVGGSAAVGRDGFSPFEIFPTGFAQSGFSPVQRRHDPLAPDSLDFHETSIEFDPTCDLVIVFPVPLQVEESALRTLGRIGEYCMLTRGKARKMIPEKEELEQGLVPEEEIPTSSSRSTISHDLTSTTTTPDPLNELSQQLSQLLAIMTMQQKEQNALREELDTMKADRQNQQLLTSKGASSIEIEENKPYLEPKLTNNERTGRTRCADPL